MKKTLKKTVSSNKGENPPLTQSANPMSPNNGKTTKPVYLFYLTPSNKDKKKIEFSENIKN